VVPAAQRHQVEPLGFVELFAELIPQGVVNVGGVMEAVHGADEEPLTTLSPALIPGRPARW
jgi:hypothetical protein